MGKHAPEGIEVLPFDLIGTPEELQQAASSAVNAFPDAPLTHLMYMHSCIQLFYNKLSL